MKVTFIVLLLFFSFLCYSRTECGDKYFGKRVFNEDGTIKEILIPQEEMSMTEFLSCAQDEDFSFPSWCAKVQKQPIKKYLRSAAEFVNLKAGVKLLVIGMAGEGYAIKGKPRFNQDELTENDFSGLARKFYKDNYPRVSFDSEIISDKDLLLHFIHTIYHGWSLVDDGTDTFGLEFGCLKKRGLFPSKFTIANESDLLQVPIKNYPDIVIKNHDLNINEDALRFSKLSTLNPDGSKTNCDQDLIGSSNYLIKMRDMKVRPGDQGESVYKTPEVQAYANAAMWRLSQDRLFALKEELKIKRSFSENEIIFWSKAFFNGAQGTQAGVFRMMKLYADKGLLVNENYLKKYPGVGSKEIYLNTKINLETIKQTAKDCFDQF